MVDRLSTQLLHAPHNEAPDQPRLNKNMTSTLLCNLCPKGLMFITEQILFTCLIQFSPYFALCKLSNKIMYTGPLYELYMAISIWPFHDWLASKWPDWVLCDLLIWLNCTMYMIFLWLKWPLYDLYMTFQLTSTWSLHNLTDPNMTFPWPDWPLYDLCSSWSRTISSPSSWLFRLYLPWPLPVLVHLGPSYHLGFLCAHCLYLEKYMKTIK